MWGQWQLVGIRMMVSKWLKGGAEGLKIQNIKTLFRIKKIVFKKY